MDTSSAYQKAVAANQIPESPDWASALLDRKRSSAVLRQLPENAVSELPCLDLSGMAIHHCRMTPDLWGIAIQWCVLPFPWII